MGEEQKQVIEIVPDGKYIILAPQATQAETQRLIDAIDEWCKSDYPFLVLGGNLTLKRVDE